MKIIIETIPLAEMRYPSCGDFYYDHVDPTTLHIKIAETNVAEHNLLIAIHELVEFVLTRSNGLSIADIDRYDKEHLQFEEPGDLPNCPYHFEHSTATGVERVVAAAAGIKWQLYENNLEWIMHQEASDA